MLQVDFVEKEKETKIKVKVDDVIVIKEKKDRGTYLVTKNGENYRAYLKLEEVGKEKKKNGLKKSTSRSRLLFRTNSDKSLDTDSTKSKLTKPKKKKRRLSSALQNDIINSSREKRKSNKALRKKNYAGEFEEEMETELDKFDVLEQELNHLKEEFDQISVEWTLIMRAFTEIYGETKVKTVSEDLIIPLTPADRYYQQLFKNGNIHYSTKGSRHGNIIALAEPRLLLVREVLLLQPIKDRLAEIDDETIASLTNLSFDLFPFKDENQEDILYLYVMIMFNELGLIDQFKIQAFTLYRFLLTISRKYRSVPFHNFFHAFNVTQTLYCLLEMVEAKRFFEPLELLSLLISALCHDIDHPGLNNDFQKKEESYIAGLYNNTSVLENHHLFQAKSILAKEECNILSNLPAEDKTQVHNHIQICILSTDLALHGMILQKLHSRGKFIRKCIGKGLVLPKEDRELLMCAFIKSADLSNEVRPKPIAKRWAHLVVEEFFAQSDLEKELELPVTPFMDKEKIIIPKEEINFISGLCLPLYTAVANIFPPFEFCCQELTSNRTEWQHVMDTFFSETTELASHSIWESSGAQVKSQGSLSQTIQKRANSSASASED